MERRRGDAGRRRRLDGRRPGPRKQFPLYIPGGESNRGILDACRVLNHSGGHLDNAVNATVITDLCALTMSIARQPTQPLLPTAEDACIDPPGLKLGGTDPTAGHVWRAMQEATPSGRVYYAHHQGSSLALGCDDYQHREEAELVYYDPDANAWTFVAALDEPPFSGAGGNRNLIVYPDGRIAVEDDTGIWRSDAPDPDDAVGWTKVRNKFGACGGPNPCIRQTQWIPDLGLFASLGRYSLMLLEPEGLTPVATFNRPADETGATIWGMNHYGFAYLPWLDELVLFSGPREWRVQPITGSTWSPPRLTGIDASWPYNTLRCYQGDFDTDLAFDWCAAQLGEGRAFVFRL